MADKKSNGDSNEGLKSEMDMSLDDLLSRLRDEHGVDFGQADASNQKSNKEEKDAANELDAYAFDNRPIEADYLNYNIIGRGATKDDLVTATVASEDVEEEDLPWDDDEDEAAPEQEDLLYSSVRERYLRQRGLWQDDKKQSEELIVNQDVVTEEPLVNPCVETHIYNEEILFGETESDSADSLLKADVALIDDVVEEIEEAEDTEEIEGIEEVEEAEEIEGIEEVEEVEEIEGIEEAEDTEEIEGVEEVEEAEAIDETEEIEDRDGLEELEALEGTLSVEDDVDFEELDVSDSLEDIDDLDAEETFEEFEALVGLADLNEMAGDVSAEDESVSEDKNNPDVSYGESEDIEPTSEFLDILTDVNSMLENNGFSEYDLSDALGMTSRTSYIKPRERQKILSTPIEDEIPDKPAQENAILPSRKGHKEYTDYAQNSYIKKGYRSRLRVEGICCIALVVLALIAFLVESLHLFGVTALHPAVNPTLAVAVSAMVMLVACALTIWEYVDGAILLFHGTPVPESLMLPATMIPLLYYIIALVSGGVSLSLFGFTFCICALICKLQTLFRTLREARTFVIVSREKPKRTLSTLNRDNAMPEADVFSAYLSPEAEYHCVKRTLFVDDYFKTTNKVAKNKKTLSIFLVASAVIALLFFAFAYIRLGQVATALSYAVISFFYTMPFSSLFLFEVPLLWASFSAAEDNAAIVGEAAIETFAGEGAVSFADTDLFPPSDISLANILLFRETEMERMLKYTALVFDEIHSSVSTVIMRSIPNYQLNDEIRIANIYDDGIEAYINQEQVLIGSYEFIKRFGASLPSRYIHKKNGFAQMFTAVSGSVLGKFDIDYVLDPEIPDALSYIAESGYFVAIRTLDPNLTPEFLSEKLDYKNYPVKLVKINDDRELLRMRKKVSSPIVTTDKTKSLMKALVLCDKSAFAQTMGLIFAAAGVLTGVGIVLVSILLGNTAFISGRAIVLFQLFWLLPIFFVSLLYVKNKSNKEKKKNRFFNFKK